jgi:hypothetical protein
MPPIPDPPNLLLHFDIDDESLLLLPPHPSNEKKTYSTTEDGSTTSIISLSVHSSIDDTDRTTTLPPPPSSTLSRIWNAYYEALIRRPLLVKSITAFLLMVLADLSAQGVEHLRGIYHQHHLHHDAIVADVVVVVDGSGGGTGPIVLVDWLRSLRFGVFGLIGAPWTHYYYYWLDTFLPPTHQPWTWTTAGMCLWCPVLWFECLFVWGKIG